MHRLSVIVGRLLTNECNDGIKPTYFETAERIFTVKFGKRIFQNFFSSEWITSTNSIKKFEKARWNESAQRRRRGSPPSRDLKGLNHRHQCGPPSPSKSAWYFCSLLLSCRAFAITTVTHGSENDRQTRNSLPCHDSAALLPPTERRKRSPSLEQAMILSRMYFTTTIMIRLKLFFCLKFKKDL